MVLGGRGNSGEGRSRDGGSWRVILSSKAGIGRACVVSMLVSGLIDTRVSI